MAQTDPGGSRRLRLAPGERRGRGADRDAPSTFGETLRQARYARRLGLDDVERTTRIPQKYLGALEEQAYGALPGTVYARGVLRAYAEYLGLDPEPLLEQYRPPRAREERSVIRPALPLASAGSPFSWSLLGGLLLVAAAVWLGQYLWGQYQVLSESLQVPERPETRGGLDIPEPLVQPWTPLPRFTPTVVVELASAADEATATPGPSPTAEPGAATPGPTALAVAVPSATPAVAATAAPTARPQAAVTVDARATERTYVQVWADGRQVFAETVAPGTARTFTANDSLQMRVSNAGGVQVVVNGEPQGRLGASGQAVDVTWGRR